MQDYWVTIYRLSVFEELYHNVRLVLQTVALGVLNLCYNDKCCERGAYYRGLNAQWLLVDATRA